MSQRKISKLSSILHSIPILLNRRNKFNNKLRYVSYSIPLACGLALLLILGVAISLIAYDNKIYAVEVKENSDIANNGTDDENGVTDSEKNNYDSAADTMNENFGGFNGDFQIAQDDTNDRIMAMAVNPGATLTITNPSLSATVAPGSTGYVSSNVTYSADDIESYTLRVTYANGSNSLKLDSGTATLAGAGTSGVVGNSLGDNTWGFAWGNTTAANASMTYYSMPSYGTTGTGIANGYLAGGNATSVASTTKKIVFAAKFAANNTNSGHYKTNVLLSLVATPKSIPAVSGFGGIKTMQEMTPAICNQVAVGTAGTLYDVRDYNAYTVAKFENRSGGGQSCWMTQNLRIIGRKISASDSDITGEYTIPASWTNVSGGSTLDITPNAVYFGEPQYGAYYSWFTATAGTSAITEALVDTNASGSICPKGWRMVRGGWNSHSDYGKLVYGLTAADITSAPYNFSYSGYVSSTDGVRGGLGVQGFYWTSRIGRGTDNGTSYLGGGDMSFTSSLVYTSGVNMYPRSGRVVRCLAKSVGE